MCLLLLTPGVWGLLFLCSKLINIKIDMRHGVLVHENKNRWQLFQDKIAGGEKTFEEDIKE